MTGTLVDFEELHHFIEVVRKEIRPKVEFEQSQAGRQTFSPLVEVSCLFLEKARKNRYFFFFSLIHSKPKEPQY